MTRGAARPPLSLRKMRQGRRADILEQEEQEEEEGKEEEKEKK